MCWGKNVCCEEVWLLGVFIGGGRVWILLLVKVGLVLWGVWVCEGGNCCVGIEMFGGGGMGIVERVGWGMVFGGGWLVEKGIWGRGRVCWRWGSVLWKYGWLIYCVVVIWYLGLYCKRLVI